MNHEFDEEMKVSGTRRSRRNPKMRDSPQRTAPPLSAATSENSTLDGSRKRVKYDSGLSPEATARIAGAKRRRRIIAMIVAECLALTVIFSYGYLVRRWNRMADIPFDTEQIKPNELHLDTVETMKGYWTIAVFGVDARDSVIDKYTNADVNMVCSINMDTGEINLVSVFRDSYLNISEDGSYNKLNQAYFVGGPQQAVSALNRNLDLNITHYVTFNWKTVAEAINILGGVDVELSQAEFRYINGFITETVESTGIGSHHLTSAGMNHLDGIQAVAYCRLRKMDTDFARTERQRKVISLAFDKAKEADIGVLNNIAEVIFEDLATNIELKDILHMAINIKKYHLGDTIGFPMARGDANMGKKGAVVVPQTLESNVKQLHQFLYGVEDYIPTDTIKRISSKIASDTGMYSEGKYIDKVPTDNGVVQPTKQTSSETTKASEDGGSESKSSTEAVTETSPTRQTDANGNMILETDSNGNIITGTTGATRPTGTDESTSETKPGSTAATSENQPGGTAGETSASYPGSNTETSASYPGSNTQTSASYPGGSTETTASGGPGSSGTPGSTPTAAETTASGGPGTISGISETISSQAPGSQSTDIPSVSGPGT